MDSKFLLMASTLGAATVLFSMVLGAALMILRDISAYKVDRFNRLLKTLPGITPRVLATRLKELEEAGLIERVERRKSHPMIVRWALTEKGLDVFPIIMLLAAYGAK